MTPADGRQRVAILGGGPAALAAAFELTATEELRQKYEVTVHQLGWRLGGKGASGRNAAHCNRIEEHGLHVWFGFYDNAFSMMRRCYEEAALLDPRFGTLEQAFIPEYEGVQYELYEGRWIPHCLKLPDLPGKPGDAGRPNLFQVVEWAGGLLVDAWKDLRRDHPAIMATRGVQDPAFAAGAEAPAAVGMPPRLPPKVDRQRVVAEGTRLGMDMENWEADPAINLLELVRREAAEAASTGMDTDVDVDGERDLAQPAAALGPGRILGNLWKLRFTADVLNKLRDWLWDGVVSSRLDNDRLRLNFMFLDVAAAMVNGIVSDQLWEKGFGAINDEEFRHWLCRHGAKEVTLKGCPLVRAVYSAAFCFDDGDVERPNVAAGKAAQDAIRLPFFYKGAPMYKMSYGMGDTVFAPLYKVLCDRGVSFEFFRCITRLNLDEEKKAIDSIEYIQQADATGDAYDPLLDVNGRPCWPSEPIWKQLTNGEDLFAKAVDFERDHNPLDRAPELLSRDNDDFDFVVLGIPIEALTTICEDLADADPDFKAMLDNRHTVMTQAFQIWMKQDAEQLGFKYPTATLTSTYVEPLDTYCDMSLTLGCENWPDDECVTLVAYFCGVLPRQGRDFTSGRGRIRPSQGDRVRPRPPSSALARLQLGPDG